MTFMEAARFVYGRHAPLAVGIITAGSIAMFGIWLYLGFRWFQPQPATMRPLTEYSDEIVLPVSAFGAHWRILNFRKNVKYPDGLEDAFPRAVAAAAAIGRPATISFAPRSYTLTKPLDFTDVRGAVVSGAILDASKVPYAVIIRGAQ